MKYLNTWDRLDKWGHRHKWLPRRLTNWLCYRFDKSLGMFDDDADVTWHRKGDTT